LTAIPKPDNFAAYRTPRPTSGMNLVNVSALAFRVMQRRSELARKERARKARYAVEARHPVSPEKKADLVDAPSPESEEPRERTRAAVAKEHKISERELKHVATVAKARPEMVQQIIQGEISLAQAKLESGAARTEREAARQLAEELGRPPESVHRVIQREKSAQANNLVTVSPPCTTESQPACELPHVIGGSKF